MSILTGMAAILTRNLAHGSRARRPDDAPPHPDGFRGLLQHNAAVCVGCGACAYVCSPTAIEIRHEGSVPTEWAYDAGKCTFCGRCAEVCTTRCLLLGPGAPAVATDRGAHRVEHPVSRQPCVRCGRPVIPLPGALLVKLYGDPVPADVLATRRLCERCRGRQAGEKLRSALKGECAPKEVCNAE